MQELLLSHFLQKSGVSYADGYASGSRALDSYLSPYAQKESFINEEVFYAPDQKSYYVLSFPRITLPG